MLCENFTVFWGSSLDCIIEFYHRIYHLVQLNFTEVCANLSLCLLFVCLLYLNLTHKRVTWRIVLTGLIIQPDVLGTVLSVDISGTGGKFIHESNNENKKCKLYQV